MLPFTLDLFNSYQIPHYPGKLDRVADEFVLAVDHSYRIDRRLSLGISSVAVQGRRAQSKQQGHPLSPLCLAFGPLVHAASLGTVAAMLVLAFVSRIVSHCDGLPTVTRSIPTAAGCGDAPRAAARGRER